MDVNVAERATAAVGQQLVAFADPRGVEIASVFEYERELEELFPDGGGPIVQQDRVPRWPRAAGRGAAGAGGQARPGASTESPPALPHTWMSPRDVI